MILAGDEYLTRFANSTIHQNVAETDAEVRIRVVVGTRIGVATTNRLDDEALAKALEQALAIARLQPENPDFKSLPGPQPIPEVAAFSQATADCTPEQRAKGVGTICLMARGGGPDRLRRLDHDAVRDGRGQFAGGLGLLCHDLRRHQHGHHERYQRRDMPRPWRWMWTTWTLRPSAARRWKSALRSQNPRALDPGEYTVILEPYAVQDFCADDGLYRLWRGRAAGGPQLYGGQDGPADRRPAHLYLG